jgi:hypothetical protein
MKPSAVGIGVQRAAGGALRACAIHTSSRRRTVETWSPAGILE